ncbi:MAG: ribosome recycling factor [Oscillospiraceae bacterium]|nr:ribosome recycling factor [Oscillospiraceae bacterium]
MAAEYKEQEEKMQKTLDNLQENYATLRAGRANASVLNKISVDYYGVATPLNQVASIASPEPRMLTIQPWDASLLKPIEKAIQTSDLGINPQNDGRIIRLLFPTLTEERRRDLIKQVKKFAEEAKVAVRNIRRDAMDGFKAQKKKSEITEDDYDDIEKDIQTLTDKYIKEVDKVAADKEAELLEV